MTFSNSAVTPIAAEVTGAAARADVEGTQAVLSTARALPATPLLLSVGSLLHGDEDVTSETAVTSGPDAAAS